MVYDGSFDPAKMTPAEVDVFAKPGKERPYKLVISNGLLAQVFDEQGNPKISAHPEWKVTMSEKPIAVLTHPEVQYHPNELALFAQNGKSK